MTAIKVKIAETFDQDLTAYIESKSPDLLKPDAVILEAQSKIADLEANLAQLLESSITVHAQKQPFETPATLSSYTPEAIAEMGKAEAKRLNDLAVIDGQLALLAGEDNKLSSQIALLKETIRVRQVEREVELERLTHCFVGQLVNERSKDLAWLSNNKGVVIRTPLMLPFRSGGHWWQAGADQPIFSTGKASDGNELEED
jgi:hypothetical protein